MKRLLLLLLLPLATLVPFAQTVEAVESVEINPYVGWRFGGEFVGDDFDLDDDFFDVDLDETSSYGLSVGFSLAQHWQLELLWSRQQTEFSVDEFLGPDFPLLDLDVDYYHVGIVHQWTPGQLRPFVGVSAGITRFNPDTPGFDAESRFSASVGAGLKGFFSDHFGLKVEGRLYSTLIDDGEDAFCTSRTCYSYDDSSYLVQGEVRAGLVFAF